MKKPIIFDCTLREIGYQTGWYFDDEFCKNLYRLCADIGISYMELGFFHNPEADPGKGIFRYCSKNQQEIVELFRITKNRVKLTAMRDIQRPLCDLVPRERGGVDAIRILTRSHETDEDVLSKNIKEIRSFGYEVFVNFTSAGYNTDEQNKRFAEVLRENEVETIYFADTESIMTEQYVSDAISLAHNNKLKIGLHFHNKNGTAEKLANLAVELGVDYSDVTMLGLGGKWRDGNLSTEHYLHATGINAGYQLTHLKNELIEQLIKYAQYSAAE